MRGTCSVTASRASVMEWNASGHERETPSSRARQAFRVTRRWRRLRKSRLTTSLSLPPAPALLLPSVPDRPALSTTSVNNEWTVITRKSHPRRGAI